MNQTADFRLKDNYLQTSRLSVNFNYDSREIKKVLTAHINTLSLMIYLHFHITTENVSVMCFTIGFQIVRAL